MKLHLGAGTIYLKGYINIDAAPHYLTKDAPKDILEQNTTTIDNYYKHDFCKSSGKCIADVKAIIDKLPYDDNSVDEIVLLHVLEHFPANEVKIFLDEFYRVLKFNGLFYLAVPDVKKTAELLSKAKTPEEEDWAIRLIHGTQRDKYSHHYCGYIERTLKELLEKKTFIRLST
jgi:ubiquinone/menaquinone biosynthesis C-methylase UbiE